MASIDHYLEDIELASRGEEVRDSIIDAFEALNSEGPGTMAWNNITGTPDTLTGYGVSDVPASMVSGVLALNNIPPSALERVVPVADDTARFALTSSDVQNGDTVKVLSTQKLYLVVDDTSLSTEAGYEEYKAGTADSVDWSGVLNTPDSLAGYGIEDAYTKDEVDDITTSEEEESNAGNPIVIETDAAQYAKKTHLTLEPVQDLHGYDHPWAGGAGKNLLPMTVDEIKAVNIAETWNGNVYTFNGIVYTILTDSDGNVSGISANGTATANAPFVISLNITFTGNYTISGSPSGGDWNTKYAIGYQRRDNYSVIADDGLGADISGYNGIASSVIIMVRNGYAASNLIFKPMIRLSTESDATFAPYSNICPITGVDEVEVRATGKNLLDVSQSESGGIDASGAYVASDSLWRGTQYMAVKPSASYYFSSQNAGLILRICWYDSSKQFISRDQADLYTAPATAKYAKFTIYASGGITKETVDNADLQFELGTEATTYEPFKGEYSAEADLPATIYSGTLDLETGEVVADMGMVKIGDFSWGTQQSPYGKFVCVGIPSNIKKDVNALVAICDAYKGYPDALKPQHVNGIYVSGEGQFKIYDSRYDLSQVNDWATEMADTKIVYLLETPITYQLTPQQLALFKGTNNISTNAKTVQVTYRNGELATTGDIVESTEVAKRSILGEAASDTDAKLATSLAPILGNFATAETSPASASHAVGEYLLYNKRLYKVLAAISAGQQLTIGTNVGQTNVAAELASLNARYEKRIVYSNIDADVLVDVGQIWILIINWGSYANMYNIENYANGIYIKNMIVNSNITHITVSAITGGYRISNTENSQCTAVAFRIA